MVDPLNWEALARNGIIVGLHASMEAILSRIGHKNDRPLLKGTKEALEKLWSERQECYAQADFTIDTSRKNIDEVVSEILAWLGRRINNEFSGVAKD